MKQRKKYCMLTTVSATMEAFAMPTLKMLADNGYDITIISKMSEEFIGRIPEGFTYINIDIDRGFKLKKTISTIFKLVKIFKKEKFDIIEYAAENMSFCAALAGKIEKVPIRIYSHWGSRYVAFQGWKRWLMKHIEGNIARNSTNVRQVSYENMKICYQDHVYKRGMDVKVLGKGGTIGVDLDIFNINKKEIYCQQIRKQYNIPEEVFVFGDVGHVRKDKGANELILAFQKLNDVYKDIYLILVGDIYEDDPVEPELMKWARKQTNIIFTGRVSDVYRYMASIDALIHPSYREGFGMVLQEAGAFKLPIITTDIPGPREFVKDKENGYLVPAKDEEELRAKMELLYKDKETQRKFGENNYKLVQQYFDRKIMLDRIFKDRELLLEKEMRK